MARVPGETPRHGVARTNRLSEAPSAAGFEWQQRPRDSALAISRLVAPEDLSVVFQPIVDLKTGALFAHEALVRCRVKELASPPVLFQEAVRAHCAGRLGRMIREIAMAWCPGVPLFVNVHPAELNEAWLVRPDDAMFTHDADVYMEITESTPLTHFDRCIDVLNELRVRGGVHLVVDDLGAGYSNLRRISDLEPKVVKLDRSIVENMDANARQRALVAGVVRLCEDLGATVVAEGIETEGEALAAFETGAHFGQGYYFARPAFPIPTVTLPKYLSALPAPAPAAKPGATTLDPTRVSGRQEPPRRR